MRYLRVFTPLFRKPLFATAVKTAADSAAADAAQNKYQNYYVAGISELVVKAVSAAA
jgi:hypothetical protein